MDAIQGLGTFGASVSLPLHRALRYHSEAPQPVESAGIACLACVSSGQFRRSHPLFKDYNNFLDCSALHGQADVAAIQVNADPALETAEVFTASSLYDALNRPTRVTLPDGTIIVPTYNEANFLASLKAQIRGQGDLIEFLKGQDYDAKGQRQFARYGNEQGLHSLLLRSQDLPPAQSAHP